MILLNNYAMIISKRVDLNEAFSQLIGRGRTTSEQKSQSAISTATSLELLTIIVVLLITVVYLNFIGVVAASLAFVIGRAAANLFLTPRQIKASWDWTKAKNS